MLLLQLFRAVNNMPKTKKTIGASKNSLKVFLRHIGLVGSEATIAGTMSEVKEKIRLRLGLERGYLPIPNSREHLLQYQPKLEDLPVRSMQDSFTSAVIPLSEDKILQDKYVTCRGQVRLGRLMEDMDMFAVWVCHQHVHVPTLPPDVHLPYTFVTILVDKVHFTELIGSSSVDIRLSGHVSWVGRSSMEIVVWLEQIKNGCYERITRALFMMAARNATNTGAAPVNPIKPANEHEQDIFAGGMKRKEDRQKLHADSLFKKGPSENEQTLIYNIFKRTASLDSLELNKRSLPSNSKWMGESFVVNTMAVFPEHRNAQNTVYGGLLMKSALEISMLSAHLYAKKPPKLEYIADITFEKPVSVSSFVKMISYVVYTESNFMQIMTTADILDATSSTQATSNVFHYTFKFEDDVQEVLPYTYHEGMRYLHGRRKFRYSMQLH